MGAEVVSAEECAEVAVMTLGIDEAIDLFAPEGLAASLRRAASFLCPASARQIIDAVLDALRPLRIDGRPTRDELADLVDLLIAAGDLIELRHSGDPPTRLLYLGPPSYVERAPGQYLVLGIHPFGVPLVGSDLANAIQYEGHTRTIDIASDQGATWLTGLGLHMIRKRDWVRPPVSHDRKN